MDHLTKITELVTRISQISANLGFQAATTGKKFIEPDVKLELETAHIQLMQMYDELLQSRDDYQKAADSLAAENKTLRESKLPLAYFQIEQARHEWLDSPTDNDSAFHAAVKFTEKYHGIGGNE